MNITTGTSLLGMAISLRQIILEKRFDDTKGKDLWNMNITTSTTDGTSEIDYEYGIDPDEYPDDLDKYGTCSYSRHSALFLPVLYSLLFVFGMVSNGLVFWVMLMRVKLKSMTDVCLLNLAIADLLLLLALPFLTHYSRVDWIFGRAMCKIVMSTYYIGFNSGVFFITLMSIDRYLAIVHAVYALRARTRTYGVIAGVIVWTVGILASFPEVLYIDVHLHNSTQLCYLHYSTEKKTLRVFGLFKMNVFGLVIPLTIMVFSYSMIIRTLLNCKSSKTKTIRLVLLVVVVFFCCWTPYNIASFFKALELLGVYTACDSSKAIQLSLQITEAVAYSHSCLNPIIYVFVGEKFRRHLMGLLNKTPCLRNKFTISRPSFMQSWTTKTEHSSVHVSSTV